MRWKRPRNAWNAKEFNELVIPVVTKEGGFDIERHAQFEKEFFARTSCRYGEIMPLNRALILITGMPRPKEARIKAVEYLTKGVCCFDSKRFCKEFGPLCTEGILAEARKKETKPHHNLEKRGVIYPPRQFPAIPATMEVIEQLMTAPMERYKFGKEEAERYLQQFKAGLTGWQFIALAKLLASAKETIRTKASRWNRRKKKN